MGGDSDLGARRPTGGCGEDSTIRGRTFGEPWLITRRHLNRATVTSRSKTHAIDLPRCTAESLEESEVCGQSAMAEVLLRYLISEGPLHPTTGPCHARLPQLVGTPLSSPVPAAPIARST